MEFLMFIGLVLLIYLFYVVKRRIEINYLFRDAIEYGIYDGIKKYRVKRGAYDEYILTSEDGKDSVSISEEHLWQRLRKKKGTSNWYIVYPKKSVMNE